MLGEDPADDLNGDGMITRLRIPDPSGGEWLRTRSFVAFRAP